jgi:hypothetical protein
MQIISLALKPESPVRKLAGLFSGSSKKDFRLHTGEFDRGLAMKFTFGRCHTGARPDGRQSNVSVSGLLNLPVLPVSVKNTENRPGVSACRP